MKHQPPSAKDEDMESRRSGFVTMLLFLASTHFMLHVYTELLPALLPTLRAELGVSLPQASLLVSIPLLVQILVNIPAGVASDRNAGAVMAVSFLINIVAAALIPASREFLMLLAGFSLFAVASTFYHPPGLKAASELNVSRMNLAMGAHIAAGSTGIAIGPIVLGLLMPLWGWRASFYLWMPPSLVFAVVSYLYMRRRSAAPVDADARTHRDVRSLLTSNFLLILLIGALAEAAFINFSTYITTFFTDVKGMAPSLASILFGLGPLAGIVGAFGGGFAGDRFGQERMAIMLTLAIAAALALIPLAPGVASSAAMYIVCRSLIASCIPLLNSMVAFNSDAERRSLAFSIYFVVMNIAGAVATSATSLIVEARGAAMMFPVSIAIIAPVVALIALVKRRGTP
ncbi:hypothetical protein AC482_03880 [miscellaneous Crenarchaeota group-15 archaeon DG-45]|uniref:Major facilitator superfamily (MFS) profile domain-containing protein n=1 Tax=miscellaneous Crenarchaeota group-15 archaeon DG-45 TaxID=1685127 RepID=A0A0M0BPW7_9ARCH|nr:MAG: hypothetical protein AC482_03880 [miscellaneous Crenarchaeota group-15 archaeon DG-45]